MGTIPVLICIDVEPDDRIPDPLKKRDWEGFEASLDVFSRLRKRLGARLRSPVRFSWFLKMDPQVATAYGSAAWVAERYANALRQLRACGDHVALHVHPWRSDSVSRAWIADFGNQDWVNQCVRTGIEAFHASVGQPCRSFRFGDGWMNDATVQLLETMGVQFDLTVEMGQLKGGLPEPYTGVLPDYTAAPPHPYQPSTADFRKIRPGDQREIWLIPISGGSIYSPKLALDRRPGTMAWVVSRRQDTSSGAIWAHPNPILVSGRGEPGVTTLQWVSDGAEQVEVRLHAPDGPLFSSSSPSGSQATACWVTNGTLFFLQDISRGQPLTEENTLSMLRVYTTTGEEPVMAGRRAPAETMTLDLALHSLLFARVMDDLLHTLRFPYLAIVMRSDTPIREHLRFNLEQSLDHIVNHPMVERFAFETPEDLIQRFERHRA
jgi:hypothetical protein